MLCFGYLSIIDNDTGQMHYIIILKFTLLNVDAYFWQKGPMAEKSQQYKIDRERKQQSKDHWTKMARIMVYRPVK